MRLCYPPPPGHVSDVRDASTKDSDENGKMSERGPCYRCIFPHPPAPETVQSCSEIGILGPVVGVIGTLMAMEVLKILTDTATTTAGASAANNLTAAAAREEQDAWRPTLLLYNALSQDPRGMFRNVGLRKGPRRDCLVCGEEEVLDGLRAGRRKITREGIVNGEVDYGAFCGRVEDVRVLEGGRRVSAGEFAERMRLDGEGGGGDGGLEGKRPVVVDVREEVEYELGAKVRNSIHIPISRILRSGYGLVDDQDGSMEDLLGLRLPEGEAAEEDRPIYFLCQRGNDSQIAAQKFLDSIEQDKTGNRRRNRWIGDVVGGFEALQRHQQRD
ncbi:hypothetical protein EPUS_03501 [Endocarpon pusillum Z07020]|uniref:Rhodanese domain-containing protein n=1 Tax=Endocarpon pusillum (strain Z07020 / HMAS-L-300199) TaxID=1263415 RepID=U1GHQ4_ENDPU|nr:uncharacterized protein EPUS_03501 [Endocarpon pusillum Z07020]ERF71346.1 hypothetical protein EPUS_03501 [Endocarpon pusillum Z07020]